LSVADSHKVDLKLKRLRAIEADYRTIIKRAESDYRNNFITREKLEKIKKKCELKIEKMLPKVRKLQHIRNQMRAKG